MLAARNDKAKNFASVRAMALALGLMAALSGVAGAQQIRVLTFDVPPFSVKSPGPSGQRGVYVEIMEAVLKDLGIEATVEFAGNAEGQKIARESRDVVFFPLARNPEREAKYRWIDVALEQKLGFVTLAEKGPIMSLEEGRKVRRLGAIEGSSALRYIESRGFENIVRGSDGDLVPMLAEGRIDAYFSGFLILQNIAREKGIQAKFAFGHVPVVGKPWFAAGPDSPGVDMTRWQVAFARLRDSGELDRIKGRYFGD